MGYDDVIEPFAYLSAAVPVFVCMARWRDIPLHGKGIVAAFLVSFLMDTVGMQYAHFRQPNSWLGYYGYPLQFGILLGVVAVQRPLRRAALWLLFVVAVASLFRGTLDQPETFVRCAGGVLVCGLAWGVKEFGLYRRALFVYAGATIPLVIARGVQDTLPLWAGYQGLRIVAAVLLVHALTRKEVAHEGHSVRVDSISGKHRARIPGRRWNDYLGHHPVAQAAKR